MFKFQEFLASMELKGCFWKIGSKNVSMITTHQSFYNSKTCQNWLLIALEICYFWENWSQKHIIFGKLTKIYVSSDIFPKTLTLDPLKGNFDKIYKMTSSHRRPIFQKQTGILWNCCVVAIQDIYFMSCTQFQQTCISLSWFWELQLVGELYPSLWRLC